MNQKTGGHAPPPICTLVRGRGMGMVDGGFNRLPVTDAFVFRPVRAAVPFLGAVDVPEFQRIDVQNLSQLVNDRFRSKGSIRAAPARGRAPLWGRFTTTS